LKFNKMNVTK